MQIGIVGAPNQGKSTFFNAATQAGAEMAPYPFTTIKPSQGVGYVEVQCPCKEFKVKCTPRQGYCKDGRRFVPVTMLDVAGLVPDAHEGKGLGNQFLGDLAQANALIHVIDCSGKTDVAGESKPQDYENVRAKVLFLEKEVDYWMKGMLEKSWQKFARQASMEHLKLEENIAKKFSGLGVNDVQVEEALNKTGLSGKGAEEWSSEDLLEFSTAIRRISKPLVIVANKIDVEGAEENYERLKKEFPDYYIVPCSAECELALRNAEKNGTIEYVPGSPDFKVLKEPKDEKHKKGIEFLKNFLDKYGTTGVQKAISVAVFDLLGYITIFPAGSNKLVDSQGRTLPDAFLLPPESTALDFAYFLHSDFGDKFVCAIDVRKKMKIGKEHKLKNLDMIELVCGK